MNALETYGDKLYIGAAIPNFVFASSDKYSDLIMSNFNCYTCENEMKPEAILDSEKSRNTLPSSYRHAAVKFDSCEPAVKTALTVGAKLRLHTLVWHSQTPDWFFTEDYTRGGAPVCREVMLCRMENYIKDVLAFFLEGYPDLIYAVDVVNEAFDRESGDENGVRRDKNMWYQTVGDDYYYQALLFARKYAGHKTKLFYNDYSCMYKPDMILSNLKSAKKEGLLDGIGMQSHLSLADNQELYFAAMDKFAAAGYEIEVTELDVGVKDANSEKLERQGEYYQDLMDGIMSRRESGTNISAVTVWGLSDHLSWRRGEHALLFDESLKPKPAYYGFLRQYKRSAL